MDRRPRLVRIVNNLNHALIKNSNQALQRCFDDEPLYQIETVSMTTSFSLFASFVASKLIFDRLGLLSSIVLLLVGNLQVIIMEVKNPVKHWNLTLDGWIDVIAQ